MNLLIKEARKAISFTITWKIFIGINVIKEIKGNYSEDYKTLKNDIEGDTVRWKDLSCPWIGRMNIIKMARVPKSDI
jgi:hypothetical protein